MKRLLAAMDIDNERDLRNSLQGIWTGIPQRTIDMLIEAFRYRLHKKDPA
jgi:hypothetical protein